MEKLIQMTWLLNSHICTVVTWMISAFATLLSLSQLNSIRTDQCSQYTVWIVTFLVLRCRCGSLYFHSELQLRSTAQFRQNTVLLFSSTIHVELYTVQIVFLLWNSSYTRNLFAQVTTDQERSGLKLPPGLSCMTNMIHYTWTNFTKLFHKRISLMADLFHSLQPYI